jgi:tetratricopeptide (TPR) repeat protein
VVLAATNFTMSRFVNLEFGDQYEDLSSEQQSAQVKDEAYYFGRARTAFENGDFEAGLRLYSKVLEFNPQNTAAWTGQVRMLIELAEYREAKLWADKALEKFPHEPELLAAKAVFRARSPSRTLRLRNAATHLTSGSREATCCWRAKNRGRTIASTRRCCSRRRTGLWRGWRRGFAITTSSSPWH